MNNTYHETAKKNPRNLTNENVSRIITNNISKLFHKKENNFCNSITHCNSKYTYETTTF